jgi:hypothetical protein
MRAVRTGHACRATGHGIALWSDAPQTISFEIDGGAPGGTPQLPSNRLRKTECSGVSRRDTIISIRSPDLESNRIKINIKLMLKIGIL